MNQWEQELQKMAKEVLYLSHRYDLRIGRTGPVIYCTTCARTISDDLSTMLLDVVEEAQQHELANHF